MAGNLLPLALLGGVAVVMSKRKKKKSKGTKGCPSVVTISGPNEFGEEVSILGDDGEPYGFPKVALDAINSGERDIIKITKLVLSSHISPHCVTDPSIQVSSSNALTAEEAKMIGEGAGYILTETYPAPEYFVWIGGWLLLVVTTSPSKPGTFSDSFEWDGWSALSDWWVKHGDGRHPEDVIDFPPGD